MTDVRTDDIGARCEEPIGASESAAPRSSSDRQSVEDFPSSETAVDEEPARIPPELQTAPKRFDFAGRGPYNPCMNTRKIVPFLLTIALAALPAASEIGSLAHLFRTGKTVHDTDGDGIPDRVSLTIIIPNAPTSAELILAGDIAARANLESLVQDVRLIMREDDVPDIEKAENPIIIGTNVSWLREAIRDKEIALPELGTTQGVVGVFASKTQTGLFIAAGSEDALLQTGRAFFLRWPYLWDVWGREEGATFDAVEKDVTQFLAAEGIALQRTVFRSALYEFPPLKKGPGALKKLAFNAGEIKDLAIDINVPDADDLNRTFVAFEALRAQHARGQKAETLSYAGCAKLSVFVRAGKKSQVAEIPRLGAPKRILTASYRDPSRGEAPAKDFDLLGFLSPRGAYGDMDRDGIADSLDTKIIVGPSGLTPSAAQLASRLVLDTAGASFPVFYLDKEIENRKTLAAPVLVGSNALLQDLQRIGKFVSAAPRERLGRGHDHPQGLRPLERPGLPGRGQHRTRKGPRVFQPDVPLLRRLRRRPASGRRHRPRSRAVPQGREGRGRSLFRPAAEKARPGIRGQDARVVHGRARPAPDESQVRGRGPEDARRGGPDRRSRRPGIAARCEQDGVREGIVAGMGRPRSDRPRPGEDQDARRRPTNPSGSAWGSANRRTSGRGSGRRSRPFAPNPSKPPPRSRSSPPTSRAFSGFSKRSSRP